MSEHILIVGAGAVGQVYAYYLAQAGYHVHFLIKEKYVAEAEKGFVLYNLRLDKQRKQAIVFNNFTYHTSWQSVQKIQLSQVWLCVSGTAFAAMDLDAMKAVIGDAFVMALQPDPDDIHRLQNVFGKQQVTACMITMISYHTPMPTEQTDPEGIAFWIPPFLPMPIDGEPDAVKATLAVLKKANINASWKKNHYYDVAHVTGFMNGFLAVLELSNWQFKQLANDKALAKTMVAAQQEIFAALEAEYGVKSSLFLRQMKPWMLPTVLTISRYIAPLNMETYLKEHFMKVRAQTMLLLQAYVQRGNKKGLATPHLQGLLSKLVV